jgi:hypothetical protein
MNDTTRTLVVFRKWPKAEGGDVIALFPYLPATPDPALCDSFQHSGRHSAAEPVNLLRATKPATPAEYAPLKAELEAEPYNYTLDVSVTRIAIGELSTAFGVRKAQIAAWQVAPVQSGEDQPADRVSIFAGLPDPDGQNSDRASWAQVGLEAFADEVGLDLNPDVDGPEDAVHDLIVDLAHYCQREGLELGKIIAGAVRVYSEETGGKGTQFGGLGSIAPAAQPAALVTISGGVANLAYSNGADVHILDYDNLNESIKDNEAVVVSREELAWIRQHDDAGFIADVERLAVSDCCAEPRKDGVCTQCGQPAPTVQGL